MIRKTCIYCGKDFIPIRQRQKFCSNSCNSRYYGERNKKMRICKRCNKEFWTPDASKKRSIYCPDCAVLNKEDSERRRIAKSIKHYYIKVCPICNKEFKTTRYNQIVCGSDECKKKYDSMKSYEYSSKKERKTYKCKLCGREFVPQYGDKSRAYCCEEHRRKAENRNKHIKDKGGYAERRKQQMKNAFIEPVYTKKLYIRDKGLCGICGRPIELGKDNSDIWGLSKLKIK